MDEGSHGHSQRGHSSSSTVHQYLTVRWVRPDDHWPHDYCSYSGEDRISELPDSILIHILSFLPIGDVIATATLSKRWRFLWPVVPNLVFNRTSAPPVSFIDRALLFNECSQIKKFSVGFSYKTEFQSAVDVWLRVATRRNVEELDLDFDAYWWDSRDMYKLPQYLYTNLSLVKLALRRCSMNPSGVISWPSLKSLSIGCNLELNDKLVEDILSGSPVLEYLQLYSFSGINRLNITSATLKKLVIDGCERRDSGEGSVLQISAPKVESLSILGHMHGKVCSVTNVPSLLRATLDFELKIGGPCGSYRKLVTDLFKALNHVEELTIGSWCLQVLSLLELTNLISSTSKFKSLILSTGSDKWDHPGIANLLRSSVYLETLVINMSDTYCSDDVHKHIMLQLHHSLNSSTVLEWPEGFAELYRFDQEKYWNSQEGVLVNSLQRLKTVKIVNDFFNGEHIEQLVELLRVLLKNARVLEKMVICEQEYVDHPASYDSLEAAQRLICFPRASPNAVLILPRTLY